MAALIGAGGCGGKEEPKTEAPAAKPALTSAVTVSVGTVERRDIEKTASVNGSLVALKDVVLGAEFAGRVTAVLVQEGDPVGAGQVVATMDSADFMQQLRQAQANIDAAITREEQARQQMVQAQQALKNAQTTLEWTRETTSAARDSAEAGLRAAQERLAVVKKGARDQERRQAEEQVRAAKANYDKTKADLKRYQQLYRDEAISGSQLDLAQSAFDAAQANYESAQQALSLIREGARPEDIRQAELAVEQAQKLLDRAVADEKQIRMRAEDVSTARAALAAAQEGVRAARSGVSLALAGRRLAQQALAKTSVRSSVSGYVAERMAEPGQQVGGGGPLVRVVAPGSVYFQAILSESQYAEVKIGSPVRIRIDAVPGVVYEGKVTRLLPVASSASRSFTLRVDFQTDARLRPGMFARGEIRIGRRPAAIVVPKDAVLFDPMNDRNRIFVAGAGDKAEERMIEIGYTNPQYVEALKGVRPGEKVIVAGQNALQSGDRIEIQ